MDRERINGIRRDVERFLAGEERVFSFPVDCPLPKRIEYIYRVLFPGLALAAFYLRFTAARIAQYLDYSPLKVLLYRLLGVRIGKGVFISPGVIIDVHFPSLIVIEDFAIIGWGARLFTHEYGNGRYRIGRIRIGEGALVGGFAAIRGGVFIGREAEVPYGAVLYRDLEPGARPGVRDILRERARHG